MRERRWRYLRPYRSYSAFLRAARSIPVPEKLRAIKKVAPATLDQSPASLESGSLGAIPIIIAGVPTMWKSMAGLCALALCVSAPVAAPAEAQETGVASIHSWVKVGRKNCMLDHFHDGSGTGSTKQQAERAAIGAWTEFTAWEYGSPWGRYSIAVSKSMNCSQSSGSWSCQVQARPCRPY